MKRSAHIQPPLQNCLLAGLSREGYARFAPHLEHVPLPVGEVLSDAGASITHAYFVNSGMISVVATLCGGDTLEVGVIGREGIADINLLLGSETTFNRVIVQVAGTALRMKANVFLRLLNESGPNFRMLGQRYVQYRINQVSQSAICNHAHEIEARLARWLLTTADTVGQDRFDLTHEFLSQMLGSRRSSVTLAAGVLSQAGMIEYSRGRILIRERAALVGMACECYTTLNTEFAAIRNSSCIPRAPLEQAVTMSVSEPTRDEWMS